MNKVVLLVDLKGEHSVVELVVSLDETMVAKLGQRWVDLLD
jgi:hypothetical protein